MKIDNSRATFDRLERAAAEAIQSESGRASGRLEPTSGSDQVSLSPGARFATSAVSAAERSPEIRQDKVERARALLDSGKLGNDPNALADALIDRAISTGE